MHRRSPRSMVLALLTAGLLLLLGVLPAAAVGVTSAAATTGAASVRAELAATLGPNVRVFDPTTPTSEIKAAADAIAAQQLGNQFGSQRYALLFLPGTYGSAEDPLNIQVGYYTTVAGLGRLPGDVVIKGSVYVRNQCENGSCVALNNFWRSLSNLTIDVTTPDFGCYSGEFWAVSQAAPMRRVDVRGGTTTLMDYCTGPSFASGGFIADSRFGTVINGSQQQWFTRNSVVGSWTNGVWNQVFAGVEGAPAECFPAAAGCGGPYTTLATSPVTREAPYLYVDEAGKAAVFVPAPRTDSAGVSWADGPEAGRSIPLSEFHVASPADSAREMSTALARGENLLLTPGVYDLDRALAVKRPGTVVLGLGMATLVPTRGNAAVTVADVPGVDLAGFTVDAGPVRSDVLVQVGPRNAHKSRADDPTSLHDVFFRIGGAAAGRATVSLEVNSDHVLLDDIWAWRADHGNGVGWAVNEADTGVVVNGDDVSASGLFVEHYQKDEVVWNGERGRVVFFQNELPYDPPSQDAWRAAPGVDGYPALRVASHVREFSGTGMGSYSFFNQGVDVFADHAFEVPTTLAAGSLRNLLTIFLDPSAGRGGIRHVVNDTGGSSTIANPDVPVTVTSYP
ncbi:MAG TPA: adenylyl cyclase [Phycicoccus sp.]